MKVAWWSCTSATADNPAIYTGQRLGATVFVSQGDDPYMQMTATAFGGSRTPLDKDSTVADFVTAYEMCYDGAAVQSLVNGNYQFYKMPDDHEWGGDNWDHTTTQANAGTGISAVAQTDVDVHYGRGITAHQQIVASYCNNVSNTDSEAIAEKPSNADASTAASNYPVIYYRVGYDFNGAISTSPDVECFFIDCFSYRSPLADADNASKTMLGANQKAWLKARMLASTATFKVIFSGKRTYMNTAGNADTWASDYTTERDEILQYIEDNSITGVIWCAGDQHYPHAISTTIGGGGFDHVCVTACPAGVETNTTDLGGGVVWAMDGNAFGFLDIQSTYIEATIRDVVTGNIYWKGRVNSGSNALATETLEVSI